MSQVPFPSPQWLPLCSHFYHIDVDTIFFRANGEATLESTILYTNLCKRMLAQNGYVLSIIDLTISGVAPPEARRYQAQAAREMPAGCSEVAVYGMNRLVRAFVQLTARAASLLTGHDGRVEFVQDEAAALRWRDERRAVLQARFGLGRNA